MSASVTQAAVVEVALRRLPEPPTRAGSRSTSRRNLSPRPGPAPHPGRDARSGTTALSSERSDLETGEPHMPLAMCVCMCAPREEGWRREFCRMAGMYMS
eukprot:GHVU01122151.1.p2 GENE.GHVU01122151.1~~GHVU01122151.1.p2  ORF type:complete len:100 (+),score=1.58 GHVU01122151.1:3-302(+)